MFYTNYYPFFFTPKIIQTIVKHSNRPHSALRPYTHLKLPTELVCVSWSERGGAGICPITSENGEIFTRLDSPESESVWIETVDRQQMQCWVLYPPKFDESKVYPAIEIVLGGPQGTNSQDWSYGGYSAYMLEGMHGDLYDCFIAHAGIFDEKMLWFTTEEMWFANWDNGGLTPYAYESGQLGPKGDGITFGGMQQAGAPYASTPKAQRHYANSSSSMVTKWHTPILCIHGGMDFRIPYSQGMAAFNAAQMMGVPSKLVIFPDENHWILQPQNALYWHRTYFDWLERWMK